MNIGLPASMNGSYTSHSLYWCWLSGRSCRNHTHAFFNDTEIKGIDDGVFELAPQEIVGVFQADEETVVTRCLS